MISLSLSYFSRLLLLDLFPDFIWFLCDVSFRYFARAQLARHCLYLPSVLRISTLAQVSKARIAKKSKCK